jgi:hypothetical protein
MIAGWASGFRGGIPGGTEARVGFARRWGWSRGAWTADYDLKTATAQQLTLAE